MCVCVCVCVCVCAHTHHVPQNVFIFEKYQSGISNDKNSHHLLIK